MKTRRLSPEFLLLAACCRWPQDARDKEEAARIIGGGVDWDHFEKLAERHRVEGIVFRALREAGQAPAATIARLEARSRDIAAEALLQVAESARLHAVLDKAGLPSLSVKGVTLARIAYGTLSVKQARDIDLLVLPDQAMDAIRLLRADGYQCVLPEGEVDDDKLGTWIQHYKETAWVHPAKGVLVEIHTSLTDSPELLPNVDAATEPDMVEVAPGVKLPTLPREILFTYLCVHGAAHAWSRLKWLADIAAWLRPADPAETARLYRRSVALGAGRSSAQALLLAHRLLGLELGPDLKAELESDRKTSWLVALALRALTAHGAQEIDERPLGTLLINLSHFLLLSGVGYKAKEAARKLSNPHDRMTLPLPRALSFLYPVIAVPRWLWRRWRMKASNPSH